MSELDYPHPGQLIINITKSQHLVRSPALGGSSSTCVWGPNSIRLTLEAVCMGCSKSLLRFILTSKRKTRNRCVYTAVQNTQLTAHCHDPGNSNLERAGPDNHCLLTRRYGGTTNRSGIVWACGERCRTTSRLSGRLLWIGFDLQVHQCRVGHS